LPAMKHFLRLDRDLISPLYHAAKFRRVPMIRFASQLVREGLARLAEHEERTSAVVREEPHARDQCGRIEPVRIITMQRSPAFPPGFLLFNTKPKNRNGCPTTAATSPAFSYNRKFADLTQITGECKKLYALLQDLGIARFKPLGFCPTPPLRHEWRRWT
jgi:predicted flap endonuclease-1-like 5' DNA nuclease